MTQVAQPVQESVIVRPYDWVERDKFTDQDALAIHCWALNQKSEPCLLRINDFPAFCQIELPTFVRNRPYHWTRSRAIDLMNELSKHLKEGMAPFQIDFSERRKLYYYRKDITFPIIRAQFSTLEAMRNCNYLLQNALQLGDFGWLKLNVWEASPDISAVRKLLTTRNIRYTQWFSAVGQPVDVESRISTAKHEYIIDWKTMTGIKAEECKNWSLHPGILAMDIECYSNNHRAMPDKYSALHVAYMISCIYQREGKPETRKRYAIIMGDCNHIPKEKLDNCTLIKVEQSYQVRHDQLEPIANEIGVVQAYANVLQETDPEIVTGYNILGFDYPYLNQRVKRELNKWPVMGRIIGQRTDMDSKTWKSGAYGYQTINILHMEGRISIDLLPIIKREHKLDKYDLNTVSKKFLGPNRGKHDVKAAEMFLIYEDMRNSMTQVVRLARQAQDNPEIVNDVGWQIRKHIADEAYVRAVKDTTRVMEYCIQDSELVIDLMSKLNIWTSLVEMSSIVGVTIVDLFTRGQQVRCVSLLYDLAAQKGYIVDKRDIPGFKFTGGFVFDPIPGLYENIICLDFSSLYPSIIRAKNICYTTLVPPELMDAVADEDCHIIEFTQKEIDGDADSDPEDDEDSDAVFQEVVKSKKKVVTMIDRHYLFKFYKRQEGLLPQLVRQLVTERKAVQADMKKEKNKVMKEILNARQLALKVCANSYFGFLGVHTGGKMPLIEGAMSITAVGRGLTKQVTEYVKDKYDGVAVYGDTDSVMMDLKIKEAERCDYWGMRLSQEISGVRVGDPLPGTDEKSENPADKHTQARVGLFGDPILSMAFEKAMRLLCIRKKKYAALLIGKDGQFKREPLLNDDGEVIGVSDKLQMLKRGIVLARRDNCMFLRKTYTKILDLIMTGGSLQTSLAVLVEAIKNLLANKIPIDDLVTIRELGANYKSDSYFMKVFAEDLRAAGKIVNPGDRLDFVIVKGNAKLLGHKMRLLEQYIDSQGTNQPEEIDYNYYIEKALMNPLNQLFEVGYKKILDSPQLRDLGYRPSKRHKTVMLSKPVKLILKMHAAGLDFGMLPAMVAANLATVNINVLVPAPIQIVTQPVVQLPPRPAIQLYPQPSIYVPIQMGQSPSIQIVSVSHSSIQPSRQIIIQPPLIK